MHTDNPHYPHMILGIDNGISGGLAFIKAKDGTMLRGCAMPVLRDQSMPCATRLYDLISDYRIHWPLLTIVIEECPVHSRSKAAMRSMAISYGLIIGVVRCVASAMSQVTTIHTVRSGNPKDSWQRRMLGHAKVAGENKAKALALAQTLWPEWTFIPPKGRTPHAGIIDAALIAEDYRRRLIAGTV